MKKFVILLGAALVGVYGAEAASIRPDSVPLVLAKASDSVLKAYHDHASAVDMATVGSFADVDYIPPPYMPAPAVVLEVYRIHAAEGDMQREALQYLCKYGLDVEKDIANVMLIALDAFGKLDTRQIPCLELLSNHGTQEAKAFAESVLLTFGRIYLSQDHDATSKDYFEAYLGGHNTKEKKDKLRGVLFPVAQRWPWISKTLPMQELGIELMEIDC